jgi:hypothetical protein
VATRLKPPRMVVKERTHGVPTDAFHAKTPSVTVCVEWDEGDRDAAMDALDIAYGRAKARIAGEEMC